MQETSANPVQVHIATQTQNTPRPQPLAPTNPPSTIDKPKRSFKKILIILIALFVISSLIFTGIFFYRNQKLKIRASKKTLPAQLPPAQREATLSVNKFT